MRTQGGKNDIVGAAVGYIRELEGPKGWLRARNQELLERAATRWSGGAARNAAAGGDMVVKVRAESEDFFAQLLTACEAGYHMMPHICRISSQTPFVLPPSLCIAYLY